MVLWPESECRMLVMMLGVDRDGDGVLAGAVDDGGDLACDADAACVRSC